MSTEAWAAFFAALYDAVYPLAVGAIGGWWLRGEADRRERRHADREKETDRG